LGCVALLRDSQTFVEAHGAGVYTKPDFPTMWWASRPESRPSPLPWTWGLG